MHTYIAAGAGRVTVVCLLAQVCSAALDAVNEHDVFEAAAKRLASFTPDEGTAYGDRQVHQRYYQLLEPTEFAKIRVRKTQ